MFVERHPIEAARYVDLLRVKADSLRDKVETAREWPGVLHDVQLSARECAAYRSVLDPASADLWRNLRLAGQAVAAIFGLASKKGAEVAVLLGDGPAAGHAATGPSREAHAMLWIEGFYLASACSARLALDVLCATSIDVLRQSEHPTDAYLLAYADALQHYQRGETGEAGHRLARARHMADPERGEVSNVNYALAVAAPQMALFAAIIARDGQAVNRALVHALENHRSYYWRPGANAGPTDFNGFVAVGPLGLAAMARRAGLEVAVRSDYLPPVLGAGP